MNTRKILPILALVLLLTALPPVAAGTTTGGPPGLVAGPVQPNAPAARPLEEVLRPDGTLDLGGFRGSLDPRGYLLINGPNEPPRFARAPEGEILSVDGHLDDRFHLPGTNDTVRTLLLDSSGGLYVGGNFGFAGGVPANHVAHWDGVVWSVLGSGIELGGPNNYDVAVYALALDGNGNLYAGVNCTSCLCGYGSVFRWDGTVWTNLGGINGGIYALVVDEDGTLYASGAFDNIGGVPANNVARWDGAAWAALGSGTGGWLVPVYALAVDGNGNLYAGGDFTTAGGVPANHIARWDGAAWSALGSGLDGTVYALALDGSGTLYVGGDFTTAGGVPANRVATWDGTGWSPLGSGMDYAVLALALDDSGTLYAAAGSGVFRWDGAAWAALDGGTNGSVLAVALDGSGNVYAGGGFSIAGGVPASNVAHWDGLNWSALGGGGGLDGPVYALAADGSNLYVGGYFATAGQVLANSIARWDGTAWSALGSGLSGCDPGWSYGCVSALAVDEAGNLYAGGNFTSAGGVPVNNVARWDGTAWSALGSGIEGCGQHACVSAVVLDGSGNLYAGGNFTSAGGVPANSIARWDGAAWSALGSGLDGTVYALAVDGSGTLYVGGDFTTAGGVLANRVATWDGTGWSPLGSGMDYWVYALAWDGVHGHLYAGGDFTTAGGVPANHVARWDGASWSALGSGGFGAASALAVDGSDNLYALMGGALCECCYSMLSVARWDGHAWSDLIVTTITMNQPYRFGVLAVDSGDSLYVGSGAPQSGGTGSAHIARWYNSPPLAANDGYATPVDTPLVVAAPGLLANDTDPEGDSFSATLGLPPPTGTAALSPDGALVYTPTVGFSGLVAFTYAVSDIYGGIATATVVVRVGDPPLAGTLLVDDDTDSPDVRSYYTSALGRLGVAYDVWDTAAWGSPVAEVLQGHDTVLWFTGAGRADTFSAADEAVVGAYLNAGTWQIETVDGAGDAGWGNSLALDGAGYPHISYCQRDPYSWACVALRYAYLDAAGWHTETVDSATGGTSLALDGSGYPHIVYDHPSGLAYAYLDAAGWHTETVDPLGGGSSLALDAAGYPHIGYYDSANADLRYAYLDAAGWHTETVDSAGDVGRGASLALGSAGYPHVSYCQADQSYPFPCTDLRYAYLDGTAWHTQTVDSVISYEFASSLVLDATGRPHVLYDSWDEIEGRDDVVYAHYNGTAWVTETVLSADSFALYSAALVLDPAGRPHAIWGGWEESGPHILCYSYSDGNVWTHEYVAHTFCAGCGDLALDQAGSPHVSYAHTELGLADLDLATRSPGGHFFLSSEDYLHEMGLTPFGQNSLGIITYTDDVSQTDVIGRPGSPIGDGLGPYTLTLPPGWSTLWTDAVSGTQSPFRWQGSGRNNSTNLDTGHFQTAFLAWPLEGLADVEDRAEVLCAVLDWFGDCCMDVAGAGFTWTPRTPHVGDLVTFTGTVAGGSEPITYSWKLDVGSWQEGPVVTHTFSSTGVYTVVMTATNCGGAVATATHTLTVQPPPCEPVAGADFSWHPVTPTVDEMVTFTGTVAAGDEPITYTWKLGVASWMEGQVVTYTYATVGVYTVVMTATNCETGTAIVTQTLTVVQPPPTCTAVAILSVTTAISGCSVTFDAELAGDPPFIYLWDFGPFGTSTATAPLVDFPSIGTYTGTLSVRNCGDTEPATSAFTVEVACSRRYWFYLPIVVKRP